jgi:tetratricopeptide (TPR) repeat protein
MPGSSKLSLSLIVALLILAAPLFGQTVRAEDGGGSLALLLQPGAEFPLGENSDLFTLGGTVRLGAELGFGPGLFVAGGIDYSYTPIDAEASLSVLQAGGGAGLYLDLSPRFSFKLEALGGYYQGMLNDPGTAEGPTSGGNPYAGGGAGFSFLVSPSISLGAGAVYKHYLGLFGGVSAYLGSSFYVKGKEARRLKMQQALPFGPGLMPGAIAPAPGQGIDLRQISFIPVFPVFHNYYDNHSIGTGLIRNQESTEITDIKLTLLIKQYMDSPKDCQLPPTLAPGASAEIDLYALFTDEVLSITEGTKAAADLVLEYRIGDTLYRDVRVETIRFYDRNAMSWDDDRKASAFVTAKDPAILGFAKNVTGMIRGKGSRALNENLLTAMGLYEALSLYGVSYVIDPRTPYAEFSKNKEQVDFLQFPRQTLEYKAGDCDDLSILYSALLEAVGIETAFITIPGHIYMAFSLGLGPDEAEKSFRDSGELIFKSGKAWVPVEITERQGGFLKAWQTGAKQWREHLLKDQAGFFALHDSWATYEPVGLPGGREDLLQLPPEDTIVATYLAELVKFIDREIYPQVKLLEAEIARGGDTLPARNRLGVLYARYGLYDKAEEQFNRVLQSRDYLPALVNLGNIHFLNEDYNGAGRLYQRARRQAPDNTTVLLCVARVSHELEDYAAAESSYKELKKLNPALAERFAYLGMEGGSAMRAADVNKNKGVVIWDEE